MTIYTICPDTLQEGNWGERKEEYADKLKQILIDNKAPAFSESGMTGFKINEDADGGGWFANKHVGIDSHLVFTFVEDDLADKILDDVSKCSCGCEAGCPIQAFQLNVERAV